MFDTKEIFVKNKKITGFDENVMKNLLLREEDLKNEIKELKKEIDDFYKNDILETKEYKKLYAENFHLKNQLTNYRTSLNNLEKEIYKSMKLEADAKLYRIIDKQRLKIVELEKIISILKP